MKAGPLKQLRVLLWKNYKLKTRRPILFVIEIIIPLALCILLAEIRKTKPPTVMMPSYHYATGLPSAGIIPFIQGLPVIGCWDYERYNVEYYPLPSWFSDLPNIEKAARKVTAWPLIHNDTNKPLFKTFAMTDLGLTEWEATALTVSTVNLTRGFSFEQLIKAFDDASDYEGDTDTATLILYIMSSDIAGIFNIQLKNKACQGRLSDIMDFPANMTSNNMVHINNKICNMTSDQSTRFQSYTKLNEAELQKEVSDLMKLIKKAFYPIPIGAQMPVFEIYRRALHQDYRAIRTTLAAIKYYICPTLKSDMETFFINLEHDLLTASKAKRETPPLYPAEDPDEEEESPQQPHRRGADVNIFSTNSNQAKKTVESSSNEISIIESEIWYTLTEGRIFYSPQTPLVEKLIKQANFTFSKIDDILHSLEKINDKVKGATVAMGDPFKSSVITATVKALAEIIGLSPPTNITEVLVNATKTLDKVSHLPNFFSLDRWVGFENERALELAAVDADDSNSTWLWAGITFLDFEDGRTDLPDNIRYKIRMKSGYMPPLRNVRYMYWRSYPYDFLWDRQYWVYGFIYLQDMVETGIARFIGNGTFDMPGTYTQMFPYPCWLNDKYLYVISRTLPMCMVISWVYIIAISAKRIVYEKELRLKEVMQVMGLTDGVHWWAWGITLFASSSITNIFIAIILKYGEITIFSNIVIIYLLLTLFALCNIVFCFLVSVFFVQSKLAAVVSAVAFYTMYLPYTIASLQEEKMAYWMKMGASTSSTTAFGFGMLLIARFEEQGIGLQWENLSTPPDQGQEFSCLHCILMMVVDFFGYLLLTLYFQKVLPSKHGGSYKPWYYPLCWCCKPVLYWYRRFLPRNPYIQETEMASGDIEPVAKHLIPGVTMVNISKHYGGKHSPYALKGLSLKLYQGQVTALLGHNGAGKTTTMSILCGMIAPTSGYFNIRDTSEKTTDSIGVCPQHNILWDSLTIAEHILFYGELKGMDRCLIEKEMEQFIREVDLPLEKRDCQVYTLSGGMKRKLSVAIAFLGKTKTLILDEPTAGVDPKARRDIWDMIVNNKRDRTILLSTHHMEEADILGDRIAILSQGNLICCGSSLFLKRLSGGTYFLTVEIKDGTQSTTIVSAVEGIFTSVIVRSVTHSQVVMELETSFMDLFQDVCRCLDDMKSDGQIASYGISAPTMEEVFLELSSRHDSAGGGADTWNQNMRLASKGIGTMTKLDTIPEESVTRLRDVRHGSTGSTAVEGDSAAPPEYTTNSHDSAYCDNLTYRQVPLDYRTSKQPLVPEDSKSDHNDGFRLYWQQFRALFVKRWHHAKRDKKGTFAQVVLPALFIALAMSINLAVPISSSYLPRVLSMSMFDYPNYIPFEFRGTADGHKQFDQSILKNEGVTYGDKFSRYISAEREHGFEVSETFPSHLDKEPGNWTLTRHFVQQYDVCDVTYKMKQSGTTSPFPTPGFLTDSGDLLLNVTGNNLTNYLLITQPEYKLARYAALTLTDDRKDIIPEYASPYSAVKNIAKSWYLNKGYHAQPSIINALNNLNLRNAGSKHHITVAAQALNKTAPSTSHDYIMQGVPIVISMFIIAGLSFVPTSFVVYLVAERSSNAKHLQFCAGVRPTMYWLSNYTWDIFNFLLPTVVSVAVFYMFQQDAFVESMSAVTLLILLYGIAATPMFYPASFIFSIPSAAYVTLLCTNLFIAITTSYSVFTLERFPEDPTLSMYAGVLDSLFLVFPPYCLGKGFVDITYRYVMNVIYESMGIDTAAKRSSVWDWDCLGRHFTVLPITAVFWITVTILIEKYLSRKKHVVHTVECRRESSADVEEERQRTLQSNNDILTVNGLTKQYRMYTVQHLIDKITRKDTAKYNQLAVKDITFGVKKGECFGLLGINGAGKTSTFNMLTGAAEVSAGNAWLGGYSVVTELTKVQQLLGYCPQFDALIYSLTGREMLTLFAAIHGVKDPAESASSYIRELGLTMYADMQCCNYSGGNKRKLSAAIALVGSPEVLLLDEPTAGMDPGARRQLWDVIRFAKRNGTSVLLTSHSMGECEVLCDRIGIMSKGRLQCVGTPHYLKQKYGSGYSATIKSCNVGLLLDRAEQELDFVTLVEQHHNMVVYSIPQHATLTPLFAFLSNMRQEGIIEDYSVSQCTLEDVFINFARRNDTLEVDDHELTDRLSSQMSDGSSKSDPVLI